MHHDYDLKEMYIGLIEQLENLLNDFHSNTDVRIVKRALKQARQELTDYEQQEAEKENK